MTQKTIYIVDDNADFRQSAEWWLSGEGFNVESFDDAVLALDKLAKRDESRKACILLDIRMPGMSGLDMHDALTTQGIDLPVIYMTGHGDVPLAVEAMKKGAITFLEKPLDDAALECALKMAFQDKACASNTTQLEDDHHAASSHNDEGDVARQQYQTRYAKLTCRERQILEGVSAGKLNKVIAYELGISVKTVELHRARVMSKMEARSLTDLIKMVVMGQVGELA